MPVMQSLLRFVLALAAFPTAALAEPLFEPVHRYNFPDPFVVEHNGEYIAYATNAGINLPMLWSRDLVDWYAVMHPADPKKRLDGLPQLGSWAKEGFTWAPEVAQIGNRWLLYYTASSRRLDAQCIGVAEADNPRGPFRDTRPEPIICQTELGGTIDANTLQDVDGKLYIYFKNDGNRIGKRTALWGQGLSADGLTPVGPVVELIPDREAWTERVIEAPTMIHGPAGYQLFYSGGYFGWNPENRLSPYAMGYANCTGPLGPCKEAPENPILRSFKDSKAGCISGPGHQSIFDAGGQTYISFHAWAATRTCRKAKDERHLYIAPLYWKNGKPVLGKSVRKRSGERG